MFSQQIDAQFKLIDIGIASDLSHKDLVQRKVKLGTASFYKEDAMTRNEAELAVQVGYEEAEELIAQGIKCLIVGEMGIGNDYVKHGYFSCIDRRKKSLSLREWAQGFLMNNCATK